MNQSPPSALAANIAHGIKEAGYRSIRAFALDRGIKYETLRSILRGRSVNARTDTVEAIANALGVSSSKLRGGVTPAGAPSPSGDGPRAARRVEDDDEAFGEVARLVALALTAHHLPADAPSVAKSTRRVWRSSHSSDAPTFSERVKAGIAEECADLIRRRQAALGRVR